MNVMKPMTDIVESARAWAPLISSGYEVPAAGQVMLDLADTIEQLRARIAELEGCLEPFAKMGEMANFAFAPALFSDRDSIKELPWSENGEPVTITYGDLRRAAAIRERTDGR